MRKAFKYRIYPREPHATRMANILEECRWLYNHLLEQREVAWVERQESIGLYDQHATLPALKQGRPSLVLVHSQVLQNVAVRIDLAFKAFFRRVKSGEKPGYPRFRGQDRYDSFCYPQAPSGCKLIGNKIELSKVGQVKVKLHRPIQGVIKTVCIQRTRTGKWFATFSCECDSIPIFEPSAAEVGIDVGLTSFATLSTGETIENPHFFRKEEKALAKANRRLAKEAKGTARQRRRRKVVARTHERITNRRKDFAHQQSRKIVNGFGLIVVEDLEVNRLTHNHCLAKSISDAAWAEFRQFLFYKAEWASRTFVAVNPAYTSQTCHLCGHRQKMPLEKRTFDCPCCGLSIDRDHNASLNILALGLQSTGNQSVEACGF